MLWEDSEGKIIPVSVAGLEIVAVYVHDHDPGAAVVNKIIELPAVASLKNSINANSGAKKV